MNVSCALGSVCDDITGAFYNTTADGIEFCSDTIEDWMSTEDWSGDFDDTAHFDVDYQPKSRLVFAAGYEPPSKIVQAQSRESNQLLSKIRMNRKTRALNDGGCGLPGLWNDKSVFTQMRYGKYSPARMGDGRETPILAYGTVLYKTL